MFGSQPDGFFKDFDSGGPVSINIDINGSSYVEGQTTDIDIPVVDSEDTPGGSKVGDDWEIPDLEYDLVFQGVVVDTQSRAAFNGDSITIIF